MENTQHRNHESHHSKKEELDLHRKTKREAQLRLPGKEEICRCEKPLLNVSSLMPMALCVMTGVYGL